jgi:hypothetical protein
MYRMNTYQYLLMAHGWCLSATAKARIRLEIHLREKLHKLLPAIPPRTRFASASFHAIPELV